MGIVNGATGEDITLRNNFNLGAGSVIHVDGADRGTLAGRLAGADFIKRGAGTLALSSTNGFTGGVSIEEGIVSVGRNDQLGAIEGAVSLNGGWLQVNNPDAVNGATSTILSQFLNGRSLYLGDAGGGIDSRQGQYTNLDIRLAKNAQGDASQGALVKTGLGRLNLRADQDYQGGTYIRGGVLATQGNSQLGAAPVAGNERAIHLEGGRLLLQDFGAYEESRAISVDQFLGDRAVYLSDLGGGFNAGIDQFTNLDRTLTADASGRASTGGFAKGGAGTLIISADQTWTGLTETIFMQTILRGQLASQSYRIGANSELRLGASDRISDTADVLVDGGNLALSTYGDIVGSFTLRNNGILRGIGGRLRALNYDLESGTINASLGRGGCFQEHGRRSCVEQHQQF